MSTNLKLNPKKEISKIFLFLLFLFFNTSNIYAHGDYTQLVTNPFVFGASISTFIVFSFMVSLINKYWNPPMNLSHWKMGLSLFAISAVIYFISSGDNIISLFFLLLIASMIPAIYIIAYNSLSLKQKVIIVFLSSVIYFVSGGICGFLYLSSL
jgi:hypothetical protein